MANKSISQIKKRSRTIKEVKKKNFGNKITGIWSPSFGALRYLYITVSFREVNWWQTSNDIEILNCSERSFNQFDIYTFEYNKLPFFIIIIFNLLIQWRQSSIKIFISV